ncbi:MAG TPA: CBS domain-containing protein [Pyrinomonadaceae bacterium]|nr:CBS domain-containing protein [Pyrinomonadaceae bacterium]
MKVKEVMTANPKACTLTDSLAEAAALMWENDCGILPVLAEGGKVVGLVTDRDICMAGVLRGRQLANIAVKDTISGEVFVCRRDDDVRTALKTMKENKVRRLPVVEADGSLSGVLSLNDIVLKAEEAKKKELSYEDIVSTYKSICEHRLPIRTAQAVGL